jgi:hypothetical protein
MPIDHRPLANQRAKLRPFIRADLHPGDRVLHASPLAHPDRTTAFAIWIIAVLTALNLVLRFPDFGAVIAQYNQF